MSFLNRQDFVLTKMADFGYVTQEESEAAQSQDLEFKRLRSNIQAPHFDYISKNY